MSRADNGGSHVKRLVDDHFALRGSPTNERKMRDHLPLCAECGSYYEQHRLLAAIDPTATSPMRRLGVGLGLRPRAPNLTAWVTGFAACTSAAAMLFLAWPRETATAPMAQAPPRSMSAPGAFTARGTTPVVDAPLTLYRVGDADRLHPLLQGEAIGIHDELAFAYRNPAGKQRLLVFGIDQNNAVHWYFPSFTDARENPTAIPIAAGPATHPLPDAVRHDMAVGPLHIHAIFTDREVTVREVEQHLLKPGQKGATLALDPADLEWSRMLEVVPQRQD